MLPEFIQLIPSKFLSGWRENYFQKYITSQNKCLTKKSSQLKKVQKKGLCQFYFKKLVLPLPSMPYAMVRGLCVYWLALSLSLCSFVFSISKDITFSFPRTFVCLFSSLFVLKTKQLFSFSFYSTIFTPHTKYIYFFGTISHSLSTSVFSFG